jgi:hypothetical protein
MSRKKESRNLPERLATGQTWKLNDFYIQIVELGKKLIHYRMLSDLRESGARIKTSGVEVMWVYLKTRHAQLVNSSSLR